MAELSEFPSASAVDTITFCWQQVEGHRRQLVTSWVVMVVAVVVADVVCPLIFAVHPEPGGLPSPWRRRRVAHLRPVAARLRQPRASWPRRSGGSLAGWSGARASARSPTASTTGTPAAHAQLPLAHGPPRRGGDLLTEQLLVGLRGDARCRLVGPAPGHRRRPVRHRRARRLRLAGRPRPSRHGGALRVRHPPSAQAWCVPRPRSSRTTTRGRPVSWPTR